MSYTLCINRTMYRPWAALVRQSHCFTAVIIRVRSVWGKDTDGIHMRFSRPSVPRVSSSGLPWAFRRNHFYHFLGCRRKCVAIMVRCIDISHRSDISHHSPVHNDFPRSTCHTPFFIIGNTNRLKVNLTFFAVYRSVYNIRWQCSQHLFFFARLIKQISSSYGTR